MAVRSHHIRINSKMIDRNNLKNIILDMEDYRNQLDRIIRDLKKL